MIKHKELLRKEASPKISIPDPYSIEWQRM